MILDAQKTSIADLQEHIAYMPIHLWNEREAIAHRVMHNFVPILPWRDRLEFSKRLRCYQEMGCDEHMAVLCAAIMLTSAKAYGFHILDWTH